MEISGDTLLNIGLILGGICLVGVVLAVVFGALTTVLQFFAQIFGFFAGILSGGPIAWCGCIVAIGGCIGVVILAISISTILSTCGTPNEVNFCQLFGY
jgi:hypothetical protein